MTMFLKCPPLGLDFTKNWTTIFVSHCTLIALSKTIFLGYQKVQIIREMKIMCIAKKMSLVVVKH